jgi:choline dehydrogenase-like flavoprotein
MPELSETQRATLRALCDTVVPSVVRPDDPHGYWARSASAQGTDEALAGLIATLPEADQAGLSGLLDVLGEQGFATLSQASREQTLTNFSLASREAAVGIGALQSLTLFLHYGTVDERGQNPNWAVLGYPGPISPTPPPNKPITPVEITGDTTLEADVVVVGSGAGGGVMAGRLAQAGLKVVVLEAGGYFDESDFNQIELWAHQNLYWRGGPQPTADLNVTLQAGACLGGGTTINWTNCLRTKDWVREEWATHGLEDLATDAFDTHLDAVWERLSVNDRCSELNGPQRKMREGAERLGWNFATVTRNWDPDKHDQRMAGYMGFGDQSGAKQSTLKTYLQDAADHGADIVVRCFAEKVLVENGRAAGVQARWADPETGASAQVTVRAPQVVVAGGTLESPALLLRSGIGGPATGDYLRLHPCTLAFGDYGEDLEAWSGAPHAGLVNEFAQGENGYGFLIEGVQYTTALGASAVPWTGGEAHKQAMTDFAHSATYIGLVRDHGHGRVSIGEDGMSLPTYALTDPVDVANTHRAMDAYIRLHHAAGARQIFLLSQGMPTWRIGDDLDAFIARAQRIPLRAGGAKLFAAHQMGTCRMGADPQTSVANPQGELHDVPGVWIGDASAFPTSTGTNPMITVMALAHRTADHVAAAAGATTQTAVA